MFDRCGVRLCVVEGDPVAVITRAGHAAGVQAVALGSGGTPVGTELGHVARAVATACLTPVLSVPPSAGTAVRFTRVLVPFRFSVPTPVGLGTLQATYFVANEMPAQALRQSPASAKTQ